MDVEPGIEHQGVSKFEEELARPIGWWAPMSMTFCNWRI